LAEKLIHQRIEGFIMQREVLIGFLDYCLENELSIDQRVQLFIDSIQNQGIHHFNVEDLYTNDPRNTYPLDTAKKLLLENIETVNSTLLEEEIKSHQIWINDGYIRISEIDVDIYEGEYCQYDTKEDNYMADFSIYIFKEIGTDTVVYSEGYSSLTTAIANYCTQNDIQINIDNLKCEVIYK
jgi:hypothetical protein